MGGGGSQPHDTVCHRFRMVFLIGAALIVLCAPPRRRPRAVTTGLGWFVM